MQQYEIGEHTSLASVSFLVPTVPLFSGGLHSLFLNFELDNEFCSLGSHCNPAAFSRTDFPPSVHHFDVQSQVFCDGIYPLKEAILSDSCKTININKP
jgi:hypothetical protein